MKIKLGIPSIGEAGTYIYTSFLFRTSNKPLFRQHYKEVLITKDKKPIRTEWRASHLNQFGENQFQMPRVTGIGQRHKEDPMLELASKTVESKFFPPTKKQFSGLTSDTNFRNMITFRYSDGDASIMMRKRGTSYSLDGVAMQKKDAVKALTKILLRSVYTRSADTLTAYIERVCDTPHNVLHCLENRTPYWFYHEGKKTEVLINTKMIGFGECALEISENIWASIKVKDLNQFLNFFREGRKRGKKWPNATPEEVWKLLFHKEPSSGQSKLMRAWLLQNRTGKMVEDRAMQLLRTLDAENPNLHYVKWPDGEHDALYVQGRVRDWLITGKGGMKSRSGHQRVDTYCIEGYNGDDIQVSSRICIDNLHNNQSVGDQIASRALLLMNDEGAGPMVHTIRHHVERGVQLRTVGQPKPALTPTAINKMHHRKMKA